MRCNSEWWKWLTLGGVLFGCGGRTLPSGALEEASAGSPSATSSGGTTVNAQGSGGVIPATSNKFTCEPGTRFCICSINQSCNSGLMCASGYCVDISTAASGGTTTKPRTASSARAGSSATLPPTGGSFNGGGASGSVGSTQAGAPPTTRGGTAGAPPSGGGGHSGQTNNPVCTERDRRLGCCDYLGAAGAATAGAAGFGAAGTDDPSCRTEFEERLNGFCVARRVTIGTTGIHVSIDATEVTRDQYAEWLGTNPDPTLQDHPLCSGNTSFVPDASCMNGEYVCKGYGCGDYPQACVDWCDARAYCNAIGKHLCGKIGGGHNPFENSADATQSEWYFACSSDGLNLYSYGSTYSPTACNTEDAGGTGLARPVATQAACQSTCAFGGVYDLNGNVWEWEDSCITDTSSATCHARGGGVGSSATSGSCAYMASSASYTDTNDGIGFRCCGP